MPKLDLSKLVARMGAGYPAPFGEPVQGRASLNLGDAGGLTQFGVKIWTLEPGAWSSQRHWHENEDEFVLMLDGELVMVEEDGEHVMRAGDCATYKAGVANGHHFINRSAKPARFLIVGTRSEVERAHYPDIDLVYAHDENGYGFTRKDGTPY